MAISTCSVPITSPHQSLIAQQKNKFDIDYLADNLKKCVGAPAYGYCHSVFQELDAYANGFWRQAIHSRWGESLHQNPQWLQIQPSQNMDQLAKALRLAYQATDLSRHQRLYSELMRSLGNPAEVHHNTIPYEIVKGAEQRLLDEKDVAAKWIDTQMQSVLIRRSSESRGDSAWTVSELARIGDEWVDLGFPRLARPYFDQAAQREPENVALSNWYKLKSFETLYSGERQIHREILTAIRTMLPQYLSQATTATEYAQLRNVEELAWKLSYQLAQIDSKGAAELAVLEAELFERIRRQEPSEISRDEAYSITKNMQNVAARWVSRGGPFESAIIESGNVVAVNKLQEKLIPIAERLFALVSRHVTPNPNDLIGNNFAQLLWIIHWDGNMILDRPQKAIEVVNTFILPQFGKYNAIVHEMDLLRSDASWLFDVNANLDPTVDVTAMAEGERAVRQTGSRYWYSDSQLENFGVPVGGAIAAGWFASLGSSFICGEAAPLCLGGKVVIGLAGAMGAGAAKVTDRKVRLLCHGDQLAQAAKTGLSVVTDSEFESRRSQWNSGLFWTMAMMGPVGRAGSSTAQFLKGTSGLDFGECFLAATRQAIPKFVESWKSPYKISLLGIGGVGVVTDYFMDEKYDFNPDFETNTVVGWVGWSMIFNETVGAYLLGCNSSGQLIGLAMNIASEFISQWMQDQPVKRLDGKRLFVLNATTNVLTGLVVKPWLLGDRHWQSFTAGEMLVVPFEKSYPRFASISRPVIDRSRAVESWVSKDISISEGTYRSLQPKIASANWTKVQGGANYVWKKPKISHELFIEIEDQLSAAKVGKWSPKLTWRGIGINTGVVLPVAYKVNEKVSNKQDADANYLGIHRALDYGIAAVFTWPVIQIPRGVDTAKAQFYGRLFGLGVRTLLNFPFPTYRDRWMGQIKYEELLSKGDVSEAFNVVKRNMRSWSNTIYPIDADIFGAAGRVSETSWRLEFKAIKVFRAAHDAMFEKATLDPKAQRDVQSFYRILDEQLQKMDQGGDVDLYEKRLTGVMATYVKSLLQSGSKKKNGKLPEVLQPFDALVQRHHPFFAKLPTLANDDTVWEQFIKSVNVGK